MKTMLVAAALMLLASPAFAGKISDVDHPDVPNCTIMGPNGADCETLTMQAVYGHNGLWKHVGCREVCGETVCNTTWY